MNQGIIIREAEKKDQEQLLEYFKHYGNDKLIKSRVECYLNHNFTIIALDKDKIVGTLQWYVKENPNAGVAEFEEVHVLKEYRGRHISSSLVEFGINSVKEYFKSIKINPRRIYLFVGSENETAKGLYEKHGFKFVSDLGNLFSDKEKESFYVLKT